VAAWRKRTSHPSQEQKTLVRFPQIFGENIAILLCVIDLMCIVCVFIEKEKGKVFFVSQFQSVRGNTSDYS
jgi:lipopolysaccharide/colanic/teichoic acid biosynthesis glycosyltransferase